MMRCAIMVFHECAQGGRSALLVAAEGGHTSAVEALVTAGADLEARNEVSRHSVSLLKVKTCSVVVRITLYLFSLYRGGWWMCAVS